MEFGPVADYASPMAIFWMRTRDAWRDATWPAEDMSAFDDGVVFPRIHSRPDGEDIGSVYLIRGGMKDSLWQWSMTVSLSGLAFGRQTNGTTAQRGEAAHAMLDCYARYLKTRPVDYTRVKAG